jgi:hypothetical protein
MDHRAVDTQFATTRELHVAGTVSEVVEQVMERFGPD